MVSFRHPAGPENLPPREALLGEHIGAYCIVREIGHGGMGVIYEAIHADLGERLAVKVLFSREPAARRRFVKEARALSQVRHPSMVRVFDSGTLPSGLSYILMELLEGASLRSRLRPQGPGVTRAEALLIARQVATALCAVHARGIVHRDLKPENLVLVPDPEIPTGERVKLLDFGIAKFVADADPQTTEQTVLGTAAYMSPEQCVAEGEIGGKSDTYALGVVLWEMLAGRPLFTGPAQAVMHAHVMQAPPSPPPDLPRPVSDLLRRMLRKEPEGRPGMDEVAATLSEAMGEAGAQSGVVDAFAPTAAGTWQATPPAQSSRGMSSRSGMSAGRRGLLWGAVLLAAATLVLGGRQVLKRRSSGMPKAGERRPPQGMVLVPGGTFFMGSTPDENRHDQAFCLRVATAADCRPDILEREGPTRMVTLSAFYLDRYEVTNEQFAAYLNHQLGWLRPAADGLVRDGDVVLLFLDPRYSGLTYGEDAFAVRAGAERQPIVSVSWDGAVRYCRSQGKELPTEAQWEFAARGMERRRFPWGDEEPHCGGVVFGRREAYPCAALGKGSVAVGTSAQDRTPQGVFDMGGNVSEWVMDSFQVPYSRCGPDCRDPVSLPQHPDAADTRVVRGGSWADTAEWGLSSKRSKWWRQDQPRGNIGFRCASWVSG